ncbi:tRNA (cytosine(32)/uridine(32)-2'-O)-methyltransferase TrmJ [Halioglobus japonicus]|uniref:tRNA (cytidine/uridine-2'-O-)-methyltransferase TrmJ n=1 Tax=Halioglobus japonicus TaxID=930805 RepID=A0AAP8MG46_9GAMM|nr:RNA methyltransferase [Halioglobus japonicus]AQA19684.1 tRNA (cytosine(32)/uridine(32)-2'-O)-methyltransferase TrmJ [Halioglobus japonicus]PLW87248.1 tRNA (cytosine(32)/uridine(32)-2'-O)-methyltransferase TrmJ [Halioglobus japonicus]GHD09426.1 tRNA (cytidine/uridine-2'-O-)-methyltransferase TrmJ [Halioglobus japonicus]
MNLDNIRIVLVNTNTPGNIGGVARAMKNMGLHRLYLVEPRQYPHEEATWRAASAGDVLDGAVVTETLDEAIADCQFVVGTSARGRRIPWPLLDPRKCAERIDGIADDQQVAILFGREDRGLKNEELQACNLHLNIPTSEDYSSLNLAMAVQVVCYELRMLLAADSVPATEDAEWDAPFTTREQMELFYEHLEQTLIDVEFLNPTAPRQLMARLRRLYSRVRLDEMELNILRGILTETQKRIGKR